jgi:hypothetical protein
MGELFSDCGCHPMADENATLPQFSEPLDFFLMKRNCNLLNSQIIVHVPYFTLL